MNDRPTRNRHAEGKAGAVTGNGKCFDCACSIPTAGGLWCVRMKRVPSKAQTAACRQGPPSKSVTGKGAEEEEETV